MGCYGLITEKSPAIRRRDISHKKKYLYKEIGVEDTVLNVRFSRALLVDELRAASHRTSVASAMAPIWVFACEQRRMRLSAASSVHAHSAIQWRIRHRSTPPPRATGRKSASRATATGARTAVAPRGCARVPGCRHFALYRGGMQALPIRSRPIWVRPPSHPIEGTIRPPGSKSYTNRALLLAGLASGTSTLTGALFSDDTMHMARGLAALGLAVRSDEAAQTFTVTGGGGMIPAARASVFVGNSGTTARFLAPMMALGRGVYELDGDEAMRGRPIQPLLDAMTALGARAHSIHGNGCLPIRIEGGVRRRPARWAGSVSSSFTRVDGGSRLRRASGSLRRGDLSQAVLESRSLR